MTHGRDNQDIPNTFIDLPPVSAPLILLLLTLTAIIAVSIYQSSISPLSFTGTLISKGFYTNLPEEDTDLLPINLPFHAEHQPSDINKGFYKVVFDLPSEEDPALVLHGVQDSARIMLNGHFLTEIGQIDLHWEQIPPRNRHIPNLIRLPTSLLSDKNELLIEVVSNWETALKPITVGSYDNLNPEVQWSLVWRVYFLWAGVAFAIPMALFFLGVWFFYKQSKVYLWLGMVMGLWPFNTFVMTMNETAFDRTLVTLIQESSNLLYATAMVCFTFTYRGTYLSKIPLVWLITGLILVFFTWFVTSTTHSLPSGTGLGILYGWIAVSSIISTFVIIANAFERRTIRSLMLAMSGVLVEIIAIWDILPLVGLLPGFPVTYVVQWGVITVLYTYSSVMAFELAMSLKASKQFTRTLEKEVASQTKHIEQQYLDILVLEKQRTISEERSRLISDMHDGTSGQLTSVIAGLKTGMLSQKDTINQLDYCARDLRLILDSMNADATEDLVKALRTFRERVSPLLESNGIQQTWEIRKLPSGISLNPHALLNVFRILQEALTNVIKHANASHVQINATYSNGICSLSVQDDGCGYNSIEKANGERSSGYGNNSMQYRANSIGADLTVTTIPGAFTRVVLELQLDNQ